MDIITSKEQVEDIEEIIFLSIPSKGYLEQTGVSGNLQANINYKITPQIEYFPSKTNINAYQETIRYAAYKDTKTPTNCDEKTIVFKVCGNNCINCDSATGGVECFECETGYAFLLNDKTKCVPISEYENKNYYYESSTQQLLRCYQSCNNCKKGKDANQHYCIECDANFPYFWEKDDGTFNCYNTCSFDSLKQVDDTYKCVEECEGNYSFKYKNTLCLFRCNDDHPYLLGTDECVDNCPTGTYISGDGTECVTVCTGIYPYISADKKQCVTICTAPTDNTLNRKICTENCNSEFPYLDVDTNTCISTCSDAQLFYFKDEKKCVSSCYEDGVYTWEISPTNKKCTDLCFGDKPYLDLGNKECIQQCLSPQLYSLPPKNICVQDCINTDYPYIDPVNNVCVAKCPSSHPYILGYTSTCVTKCSDTTTHTLISHDNTRCLSSCDLPYELTLNGKQCTDKCNDEYPYILDEGKICLDGCVQYNYYK